MDPSACFVDLPVVTIQLPIYNEMYVVDRLINAACSVIYPKNKFEIQVLDDSNDNTVALAKKLVAEKRAKGYDIKYITRKDRVGFKAGALENGLASAKGEYVAIFDADFIPAPNILLDTIHYFTDSKVGMVQTRWAHTNEKHNLLTRLQAILIDGHFLIEHTARSRSGRFFNFNGTAGIWKKTAIEESGGWQHDTLTEDLDLSYRAQKNGWKFIFLPDVVSPSELPIDMNAFKSQQHRWAKGSVQTCKKMLPKILKANLPFKVKLEAVCHLTSNFCYLFLLM